MLSTSDLNGFWAGIDQFKLIRARRIATHTNIFSNGTIQIPSERQNGDVCVIVDWAWGSGTGSGKSAAAAAIPTDVTPSGFTQLDMVSGTDGTTGTTARASRHKVSAKVLNGTETNVTGMVNSGGGGGSGQAKICYLVRGNKKITSFTSGGWNEQITTGNPNAINANPSDKRGVLMFISTGACMSATLDWATNNGTIIMTEDLSSDSDLLAGIGFSTGNPTTLNSNVDIADEGALNTIISGWTRLVG